MRHAAGHSPDAITCDDPYAIESVCRDDNVALAALVTRAENEKYEAMRATYEEDEDYYRDEMLGGYGVDNDDIDDDADDHSNGRLATTL